MPSGQIVAISIAAGIAGAGFVWFSWCLIENLLAVRSGAKPRPVGGTGPQTEAGSKEPAKVDNKGATQK